MIAERSEPSINLLYMLKMAGAFGASVWVAVPIPIQTLFILTALDYASGYVAARRNRTWDRTVGINGLRSKLLMFLLIWGCHLITGVAKLGLDGGSVVALAMCVNEFTSIIDNCDAAGVRVPPIVLEIATRARQVTGGRRKKRAKGASA
jgi:toxin secretion/phage lysis holin